MASQGNLYPPDFSGSNLASEKKAPRYVKGFESLNMNTYTMKESGLTTQENKYFNSLYNKHTLANDYEYTKHLKGYTEGFFIDISGGVIQGKGYLKESIYPAQYTMPSDITISSLKALKNKTGVGSKSIYSPNWLSQIYNDINMYSDDNILAKIFQTSYNNNSVALNDLGYTTPHLLIIILWTRY